MEYRTLNTKLKDKRIKCIHMNDEHPVPSGTEGTVMFVDDIGTIHVKWDNGRSLGLIPNEDSYELIKDTNSSYICGSCGEHVDKVIFNKEKGIDECEMCQL
jgi:hypothetical protein